MNNITDNNSSKPSYKLPTPIPIFEPTLTLLRHREQGRRPSSEEAVIETALLNVIIGYSDAMEHQMDIDEYVVDPDSRINGVNQHEVCDVQELYECNGHFLAIISLWEGGLATYKLKTVDGDLKLYDFKRGRKSPEDFQNEVGKEARLNDVRARLQLTFTSANDK